MPSEARTRERLALARQLAGEPNEADWMEGRVYYGREDAWKMEKREDMRGSAKFRVRFSPPVPHP